MSDASLTNLRMVRPKGPKIFFGVLAVGAVGVGAWWWLRPPGPVGEREDQVGEPVWIDGEHVAVVSHRRPGFTADGAAVVFTSEFDGNDRFERVGQRAARGGA